MKIIFLELLKGLLLGVCFVLFCLIIATVQPFRLCCRPLKKRKRHPTTSLWFYCAS
jgi:hypothetical protein